MKQTNNPKNPITQPLLKKLVEDDQAKRKTRPLVPRVGSQVLPPAELNQDSGGGYNADGTFVQS